MNLIILPNAKKEIKKLPSLQRETILRKLFSIKNNPLRYIERLQDSRLWKLRIGEYRAILMINTKDQVINVIKVGHRKNIYKQI